MAKWSGVIGFAIEEEDDYGVVTVNPVEKPYVGNLLKNYRRLQNGYNVNDKVVINNEISVVADPFMTNNFHTIRYATFNNVRWKVESVDVQYPRLTLILGGEYTNG